jgi:hypothetical protein
MVLPYETLKGFYYTLTGAIYRFRAELKTLSAELIGGALYFFIWRGFLNTALFATTRRLQDCHTPEAQNETKDHAECLCPKKLEHRILYPPPILGC